MRPFSNVAKRISLLLAIIMLFSLVAVSGTSHAFNVWAVLKKADEDRAAGKYAEAIAAYHELAVYFEKEAGWSNAALMYIRLGDSYKALERFDDAVASWDKEAIAWDRADKTQEAINARRKADWTRSRVELFVTLDANNATNIPYHGALYEPKNGALLGAYAEADKAVHNSATANPHYIEAFPKLTGKKHAAYLLYTSWGSDFFSEYAGHIARAEAEDVGFQVALQPMGGLDQVVDGTYLRSLARSAKNVKVPIFLRFANEMNGEWVDWYDKPAKYIEKFRLVAKVFKEEAPNVAIVWVPAYFPPHNIDDYYPGDEYVDWVGVSMYQVYNGTLDPLGAGVDRSSFVDKFEHIYNLYGDRKPVYISEGGVSYSHPYDNQDKTDWAIYQLKQFYVTLPMLYPGVKAMYWFDTTKAEGGRVNTYLLSGNKKFLDAYQAATSHPFYLSTIGETSPVAYKRVGQTVQATELELNAYVRAHVPMLSKVVYSINDAVVATTTDAPWTFRYDFSKHAGQTIQLTVAAYGPDEKLATKRNISLNVQGAIGIAAKFTPSDVIIDGKKVDFDAYLINGNNYFKLRDLAMAFTNSQKKFQVGWNAASNIIELQPNKSYTAVGGELETSYLQLPKRAEPSHSSIMMNGSQVALSGYLIEGNNFFKLRDITKLFDIGVHYDPKTLKITLNTAESYVE